jgi:hypothetical protein
MSESQNTLLKELIERAYAQRGYMPLSEQETDELVTECVEQVEQASSSQGQEPEERK